MPQVKKKSFIQKNGLIAVWTMAGFMAMGYIGFLATGIGDQQSTGTLVATNSSSSRTAQVSPVRREIADLRANIKELRSREKINSKQLSYIKEALGPNTASLPDMPSNTDAGMPNVNTLTTRPNPSTKVSINVLPLTQDDKVAEFSGSEQAQSYGIDLASALSVDSLQRHWKYLKQSKSSLLKGLQPHYVNKSTKDTPLFLLVVGPFDKLSDARGHCQALSKANVDCQETSFQVPADKIHTAGRIISKPE